MGFRCFATAEAILNLNKKLWVLFSLNILRSLKTNITHDVLSGRLGTVLENWSFCIVTQPPKANSLDCILILKFRLLQQYQLLLLNRYHKLSHNLMGTWNHHVSTWRQNNGFFIFLHQVLVRRLQQWKLLLRCQEEGLFPNLPRTI